jgi:hypothetical protein
VLLDGERIVRRGEEQVNEILCACLCMSSEMLKTFLETFWREKKGRNVLRPYKDLAGHFEREKRVGQAPPLQIGPVR